MTLIGTSCSRSLRRVAVTTISLSPSLGAVSAAPVAATEMAGHISWPAAVIAHTHCLIESERIAHPFQTSPFPHIRDQVFLKSFRLSVAQRSRSHVELNTFVHRRSRKLPVKKRSRARGGSEIGSIGSPKDLTALETALPGLLLRNVDVVVYGKPVCCCAEVRAA